MTDTFIFYDVPWSTPNECWSYNLWKTRFILNYKNIPYKTVWVEFPDIAAHCQKLGIPPTPKTDGSNQLWHTLPAIYDPHTKSYISDSFHIAAYLDSTYPDTPPVLPHHTHGLQAAFTDAWTANLTAPWMFLLPVNHTKLNPASQAYFTQKIEVPTGEAATALWKKFESELGKADEWLTKSGKRYLMGDAPTWGDFVVGSYLMWFKLVWGEESREWKEVCGWHDGRWKERLDNLKEYQTVHV